MALKKCKECGNEISKKADKCPQCGAPQKSQTSCLTWGVLIFIAFGVIFTISSLITNKDTSTSTNTKSNTQPAAQSPAIAKLDKSPATQAKRKEFIEKLITQGVLYKVEVPAELPHIFVAPGFYALDIDTKESFINVVYTYYLAQDPRADIATLYDSKSGKKIGMFTESGLDLD